VVRNGARARDGRGIVGLLPRAMVVVKACLCLAHAGFKPPSSGNGRGGLPAWDPPPDASTGLEAQKAAWAPIGQTPRLRRMSQRRELSTVIGLTLTGKRDKRHVEHALGAPDSLVALRPCQRHRAGPMSIIIWDRLHAHRAVLVKA
jgi:hypothetical protein